MGFALISDGAAPPAWPHIVCAGEAGTCEGAGWAWHEDERRRACFIGPAPAPAPMVAAAIDGRELPGIDRILAIVALRAESPGSIVRLFRNPCPACEGNHLERAEQAIRTAKHIHPEVIEALRSARVPEHLLRQPNIIDPRNERPLPEDPRKVKSLLRKKKHLPVFLGKDSATKAAQLAFAIHYKRSQ